MGRARLRRFGWLLAAAAVALGTFSVASRLVGVNEADLVRNDFTQDYLAAKAWRHGDDPYAETMGMLHARFGPRVSYWTILAPHQRNPHSPTQVLVASPLSALPYQQARAGWILLTAGLMALGVGLVARGAGMSRTTALAIGAGSLVVPVAQKDLFLAQSNGLLVGLLGIGWYALHRGREAGAGVALGLATGLKLFPVFMLVPLIREQRFKAVVWMVGVAAACTGVSMAALGEDATVRFLTEAAPDNYHFWRAAPVNIALTAQPFRWLTANRWNPAAPDIPALALGLAIVVVAICIVGALRSPARTSSDVFWAAVPWMLLASPLSWDFSAVLAFPVAVLVIAESRRRGSLPPPILMVAMAVIAIGLASTPAWERGVSVLAQISVYGLPTYGLIILGISEWWKGSALRGAPVVHSHG